MREQVIKKIEEGKVIAIVRGIEADKAAAPFLTVGYPALR